VKKQKNKRPIRRFRRIGTLVAVTAVVLAIGAITVLSRQSDRQSQMAAKTEIVKARIAAQDVSLTTAQPQQLSAEEAQKIASGMKELVNQSTEGLVEVRHADGSVSVDLEGRFQNVTVAKINKDGSISQSCVDNPKSAGAFFGFDPKLIDPKVDTTSAKPVKVPARNRN
jgi:hypothetical protein